MPRKIFVLLVISAFLYVASPFVYPLAMGAVLAVLVSPLLELLERRRVPAPLASGFLTFGLTLVVLLPVAALLIFIAKNGFQQLQALRHAPQGDVGWVESLMNTRVGTAIVESITRYFPVSTQEIVDGAYDMVRGIGIKLADLLGGLLTRLPGMTVALIVIVISIYFFLVDGPKLVAFVRRNSFFTREQTARLIRTVGGVCRSVILASLVSGGVQAIVEIGFCLGTGVPNPMLVGGLVFMGSFIPLVGSAPVTLGVCAHQFLNGNTTAGVVLLVGAVIVGTLDNLIRPLVLRGSANLHPLLGFVAAFGGLQTIGVLGIFLGPIVASVFIAVLQLLEEDSQTENVLAR